MSLLNLKRRALRIKEVSIINKRKRPEPVEIHVTLAGMIKLCNKLIESVNYEAEDIIIIKTKAHGEHGIAVDFNSPIAVSEDDKEFHQCTFNFTDLY